MGLIHQAYLIYIEQFQKLNKIGQLFRVRDSYRNLPIL